MDMEEYDAIIIGAGLAGLQTARLLGKRGLRVLLADRKNSLDQSIHTTGIFVRRTLERIFDYRRERIEQLLGTSRECSP